MGNRSREYSLDELLMTQNLIKALLPIGRKMKLEQYNA